MRKQTAQISVNERISQLSQKINTLQPKQDTTKKYQTIESMCEQLESQMDEFNAFIDQKLLDIRHKTGKISKEVKKDYAAIDNIVREEIRNCSERMMTLVEQEMEASKENNGRMMLYVEEEVNGLRHQIEKEAVERGEEGRLIEESLMSDINQITTTLDQVADETRERLEHTENQLYSRTDQLSLKLRQICTTYSDNEAEFYKMLRDLVKKVKSELHEHQLQREQTETQILNLIDKMCDKSISQGSS